MLIDIERGLFMDRLLNLPGILIAIVFHELAHGLVAYWLGDNTAKDAGRLTLNPIKHIDPVGLLCMFIFRFGWAKPVPINPNNFKNRKRDTILVSVAGVITNFIIAIISLGVIRLLYISSNNNSILYNIIIATFLFNIILGLFNLLPFPPLDGSKILASLLPTKYEYYFYKYEKYLYFVLILLLISNTLDRIIEPIINFSLNIVMRILS